ncbi:MAG TPA: bifunctional oligoribonuclease/PAP phosphatase NrnA, partial [Planctomycetaceae bacterium]|nr:bifunctional oligoribonuclease/PAP phosphatase NrnA [Planctomycetaceae bacterium]
MKIDWSPLQQLIATHQVFVITSHIRPDADAIGSEIGLAQMLQTLGKTTRIVNTSPMPPNLKFLDPQGEVKHLGTTATREDILSAEVQLIVDTSAWQQLS